MKLDENDSPTDKNKNYINISVNNPNIFFFTNIHEKISRTEPVDKKSPYKSNKTCYICGSNFFSKFSRDRHIDNVHLKKNLKKCPNCNKKFQNIEIHNKTCNKKGDKIGTFNNNNNLINFDNLTESNKEKILQDKTKLTDIKTNKIETNNISLNKKIQNIDSYEGIKENKNFIAPNCNDNNINKLINLNNYINKELLSVENSDPIEINLKDLAQNNSITEIIKKNLYDILQNNEYLAIKKYFVLKNFILGCGEYGTVWFGINLANAEAVALKFQNNINSKDSFILEIKIMEKLKKHNIFAKFIDKLIFNNKIILVETLLGPDLDKLITFCRKNISILTIYKIGVEILQCLKLVHESGYIYIDLSCKNIGLLFNPIKNNKFTNHITLIDFGFCEAYVSKGNTHLEKNKAPRTNGNIYYSSINALSGGPISRKDDIISLCYLLIDLYKTLPWADIRGDGNGKKETIQKKIKYTPNALCGNNLKEVLEIFNDANNLKFSDKPNYKKYIKLLCNYIENKKKLSINDVCFDWENKIVKIIQENGGIKNSIKNSNEIKQLFNGYPDFYTEQYLHKILINRGNFK